LASESGAELLLSVELLEPVCDVLDVWSKGIGMGLIVIALSPSRSF
jgi:hypothetical protein